MIPSLLFVLAQFTGVTLREEGAFVCTTRYLDLVGTSVTASCPLGIGTLTLSGYNTVEDEGTPLTQRTVLNFEGRISCSDFGGETRCVVPTTSPTHGLMDFTVHTDTLSEVPEDGALILGDSNALGGGPGWTKAVLPDCDADNQTLAYDQATNAFSCGDDDTSAGGGITTIEDEGTTVSASNTILNFTGATIECADVGGGQTDCTVTSEAPTGVEYIVAELSAGLSAEVAPSAANQVPVSSSSTAAAWGTVPIAAGGTGQTTQTAAYDALSPNTTQGDISYHNGTDNVRLPKGTALYQLTMNAAATAPEWTPANGATLTSSSNQSDATSANYTAITGLAFTPLANTNYRMECFIIYTSTAATTGINFAWDVPAAVTSIHMTGFTTTTAVGANEGFIQRADNVGTPTSAAIVTTEQVAFLTARLRNGANATSTTLGFTPETNNSVSVIAGSTCEIWTY